MSDHKEAILSLPIDYQDGEVVHHGLEWAKKENIVVIWDSNGNGWIRGRQGKRRRVIPIYCDTSATFTKLISGRD